MRNYFFLLIAITILSCKAQNKLVMIPEIDNKFEKFDDIKYQERSNQNSRILRELNSDDGNYLEMDKEGRD